MNLSEARELRVLPLSPVRVRISWLGDADWDAYEFVDQDGGYVDDEDVLWWLLRQNAPYELVRSALATAFPEFDVDGAVDRTTMPDRAQRRADDAQHREALKRQFRASRRPD